MAAGTAAASAGLLTGRRLGLRRIRSMIASAELVVGVGGGYLRASSPFSAAKFTIAHLSQLSMIANSAARTVYLPQSVGPFPPYLRSHVARLIASLDEVMVRDDRSLRELADLDNVTRIPDLAVLKIAECDRLPLRDASPTAHMIGRQLGAPLRDYPKNMLDVATRLPRSQWWVQSEVRGNDDAAFYREIGVNAAGPTRELWADKSHGGVAISVRLHGALEAIMSGFPTIHLSYERKGWGAYEDLGVPEYVHNAKAYDVECVVRQASELAEESTGFFAALDLRLGELRAQSADLDRRLAGV
jgi:polysaccharide pyruvyl transferase WcaK-like protein